MVSRRVATRRARLLVDLDSVTALLTPKWFRAIRNRFGDGPDPDQPAPVWDIWRLSSAGHAVYDILREPGFFRDLPLVPGAREVIWRLHRRGHEIVWVTHAEEWNFADKLAWVEEHFPFVPRVNFVATLRKELVEGDVLLDDAPHVIEAALRAGRMVVAMDYPYNRHLPCPRVSGWYEFEAVLPMLLGRGGIGSLASGG